jgi:hypothetical protein
MLFEASYPKAFQFPPLDGSALHSYAQSVGPINRARNGTPPARVPLRACDVQTSSQTQEMLVTALMQ